MTSPQKNFLGIPVEGEIHFGGEDRVEQRPLEELTPLMQALLDDETIEWFGWRQYTPYYNDGEPCVFHVSSALAVKLTSDAGEPDDDDGWDGVECNSALGEREYDYKTRSRGPYTGPDEDRYNRCLALESALSSGAFDDVLLVHFGDHATIRVSRTGIRVEFYEHD